MITTSSGQARRRLVRPSDRPAGRLWPVVVGRSFMISVIWFLAFGLSAAPGGQAGEGAVMIGTQPGQVHPQVVLPSLDGGSLSLGQFRGQKVLLAQFASW